jgi:hypothetical protein
MILESVFGLSALISVSLDSPLPPPNAPSVFPPMSASQKEAALLPLVRHATDCVIGKVTADRRYSDRLRPADINDLLVDSIAACGRSIRAMIDAHDRMYGAGSGEAFLLGPYLDVLPSAIVKLNPAVARQK